VEEQKFRNFLRLLMSKCSQHPDLKYPRHRELSFWFLYA